ncbi:MAG: adenylate/guanylate cyclase domain-containing protein [Verrucomicrobiota bacterium]
MILAAVYLDDPTQTVVVEIEDKVAKIGRSPQVNISKREIALRIPWRDRVVNRNHSTAKRDGQQLLVERCPALPDRSEPNRIYNVAPAQERAVLEDPLTLDVGESFSIGRNGRTAFYWLENEEQLTDILSKRDDDLGEPQSMQPALNYEEIEVLDDYSLRLQLKLLQQELPEKVLAGWTTEQELMTKAADFIKTALPGQRGVSAAFIAVEHDGLARTFEILNQDPSTRADFRISGTLLNEIELANPKASDSYLWSSTDSEAAELSAETTLRRVNWVAILPLASMDEGANLYRDHHGRLVYLYVEARQSTSASASTFTPFLRLIVSLVASLLAAREQQRVQDQLSDHFSPALRRILQAGRVNELKPTLTECTVLFCDRRGSSRAWERATSDEEIFAFLAENQEIISDVCSIVFEHEGVITDFAGDGVLALWGWPVQENDHAVRATTTAESIALALANHTDEIDGRRVSPVRMGISTGRIAVGNTGPTQQIHLSVFGHVVNFGARLEGMAKVFRTPCLLSEATRNQMHSSGKPTRKLCYIRPFGFEKAYPVYEMVLPREVGGTAATPTQIEAYEKALDCFVKRDWDNARDYLDKGTGPNDQPARHLEWQIEYHRDNDPGEDWGGELTSFEK